MDRLSQEQRSRNMARIGSRNTAPELTVRKLLHRSGYRYRLNVKTLPGKPDVVFPGRRKVLFIHGCFWHRHRDCPRAFMPNSRPHFWAGKFQANVMRDAQVTVALEDQGWQVLIVWECETKHFPSLIEKIVNFLGPSGRNGRESCR